ncbi:MAG: PCRF domain-containing protein, partial [Usitatibacter sp.]
MFDYDAKKSRLVEVARTLEDPGIWSDAKRAQDLGKERRTLEDVVSTVDRIDAGLKDSAELFTLAKGEGDDATLRSVAADVQGTERLVA